MTITLPNSCQLTRDSVERALDQHEADGLITRWHNWYEDNPRRARPLYTVVLARDPHRAGNPEAETRDLATLHEAHAFLCGLVSAANARDAAAPGMPATVYRGDDPCWLTVRAAIPLGTGSYYACVVTEPDGIQWTALVARRDGLVWREDPSLAKAHTYGTQRDALAEMTTLAGLTAP